MTESPPRAWFARVWILVVVLLVGAAVLELAVSARSGDSVVGRVVVVALAVLFTVAAPAWRSTSMPHPHDRTMLVEVARTARDRRAMIVGALAPALGWSQVANVATGRFGSGFFWVLAVGAVVLSAFSLGLVLVQLRCERTVRATALGLDSQ